MKGWVRLSVGGGATFLVGMGLGRFSYTPMIPALIEAGQLTASEAGSVGAFNLAGFLAGAIVAPVMRRRFGEISSLRICLAVSLVCLAASIPPWGLAWLAFWRFLVGVAMGVMMIYALSVVTRHAPPERLGAATGIVFTGVGIALLMTGTVVPTLLDIGIAAAWTGLALIGAAGVAIGFWGLASIREREPHQADASGPAAGAAVPWDRIVVSLVTVRALFSLGLIPHSIFWVDYIVRGLGHDMRFGGWHWTLFGLGALTGTYLWGRLADVIGFRAGLVLAFAALAAGVALPVTETAAWALVVSSIVVGAQPGLTAILAGRTHQLVGPARMPTVMRRESLIGGIGQAAGGYAYVALFAWTGSYVPIFLIGGGAMAAGAIISLTLRRRDGGAWS